MPTIKGDYGDVIIKGITANTTIAVHCKCCSLVLSNGYWTSFCSICTSYPVLIWEDAGDVLFVCWTWMNLACKILPCTSNWCLQSAPKVPSPPQCITIWQLPQDSSFRAVREHPLNGAGPSHFEAKRVRGYELRQHWCWSLANQVLYLLNLKSSNGICHFYIWIND